MPQPCLPPLFSLIKTFSKNELSELWMLHLSLMWTGTSYPRGLMPACLLWLQSCFATQTNQLACLSLTLLPCFSLTSFLSLCFSSLIISCPTFSLVTLLFSGLWKEAHRKQAQEKHLRIFLGHLWNRDIWHYTEEHSRTETLMAKSVQ